MHSATATKQQPDRGGAFGRQMKEWRDVRRMSQLDLSLAAEVSSRHVSFVETGRSKPSREMVLRLAQALDMPLGDRNELLGAAGYAPAYRARAMDEASMAPMNRALEHMLSSHEPYPAVVFDRLWNLKASNGAAMQLFGGLAQADETPNGMRMVLAPGPMRDMIENWNEVAYATLTRLRRELAQSGDDPDLVALWEEAKGYAQGIDLAAGTRDEPVLALRLRVGDIVLSTFSTIAAFGTAQDIGLRELSIEHIFPADAETEAFFRQAV